MTYCCPHSQSASKLFSVFAKRFHRRYTRHGFEPSQRQLLAGLAQAGIRGANILDIGCGIGHLHQTLLEQGAQQAIGIDLAPQMLLEAQTLAAQRGLSGRVHYLEGDFIELAPEIPPADITVLDKVVCCYPDANTLVHQSLAKTQRVYALTYPRDRWFTRLGVRFIAVIMWAMRSAFRSYVHDPKQIEIWINRAGFHKHYEALTPIWMTQIFIKA